MSNAKQHGETLLAAILPGNWELLDRAQRHLAPAHFIDRIHTNLWQMLGRYYEVTGHVMTRAALGDFLTHARADAGTRLAYEETFDLLVQTPSDEAAFRWSMDQLRELAAERATSEALTTGMEVLTRGTTGDKGQVLQGHAEARALILSKFAEIDRQLAMQDSPEGDMRGEGKDILKEYDLAEQQRRSGKSRGVGFGVPALDDRIDGLNPGELGLVVGYSSDGKTSLCVQLAWSAAVEQRKNVVLLTTETIRPQIRRRIISRHSCLPEFGIDGGINSRDIKRGTVPPEHRAKLVDVVNDFDSNPNYGHQYIIQVPRGATMSYTEQKLLAISRMWPIDLVVADYLALWSPERRRDSTREELSAILKTAKQISTTHNDGAGVPFVSPWQVSRMARAEAERLGYYTTAALSETAEATNSADLIVSLLAPMDNDQRIAQIRAQVMKNRDGEKANAIDLTCDYATSRFFSRSPVGSTELDSLFV